MRQDRARQLTWIPPHEVLWDRFPEERRKRCRELLSRLLRAVVEAEREGGTRDE